MIVQGRPARCRAEAVLARARADGVPGPAVDAMDQLDLRLRGDDTPGARADELLPLFDAIELAAAGPPRVLLYNICHLWGLRWMPVGPGDWPDALPAAWWEPAGEIASPLAVGQVARVRRRGCLTADGLILRTAELILSTGLGEGVAVPTPVAPPRPEADRATAALAALADSYNRRQAAGDAGPAGLVEAARALKRALEALVVRVPGETDWLALVDAIGGLAQVLRGNLPEGDRALFESLRSLRAEALTALAEGGLVCFPDPDAADLAAVPADALERQSAWSASVPAGELLSVVRVGLRRGDALVRPARVVVSQGPKPPLLRLGEQALAALEQGAAGAGDSTRLRLDELRRALDAGTAAERARPVLGLVNALEPLLATGATGAADVHRGLVGELAGMGVAEVPIAVGEAFDRYSPDLLNPRKAQDPGAREGEILRVLRRAFRGPDGQVLQQATVEVNLA